MATQTTSTPAASTSQSTSKPSTKAERRELQERQRAAKLAQKQQPSASTKAPSQSQKKSETSKPVHPLRRGSVSAKEAPAVLEHKSRGLQIFSHFNQPKTVGQGVKGDVHPAIARLALQFSEFKICGSNARCIAALTAFKAVSSAFMLYCTLLTRSHGRSSKTTLRLPITRCPDTS